MAMLIREMFKSYKYIFHDLADERVDDWFLVGSPVPLVLVVAAYVWFVKRAGPRFMAARQPFRLERLMQIYNVVHVAVAIYIVERAITLGWNLNGFNWLCVPVDYSRSEQAMEIARSFHLFFLVKIYDLVDTVFFVLRKRDRQISFLHVYHHSGMVLATWIGVKYFAGGHHTMVGLLNSIVHAVMYSYYLVTSIYPHHKNNLWWKKHITQMQMVQFLLLAFHQGHVIFQPSCDYPKGLSFLLLPQYFFFFLLFLDFYRKTYSAQKPGQLVADGVAKKH